MPRDKTAFVLFVVGSWWASPSAVEAQGGFHLEADTVFSAYEVRSPASPVSWDRTRLLQTLSFTYAREFAPGRFSGDGGPLRLVTSVDLRLEREFGDTCLVDRARCVQSTTVDDVGDYEVLANDGRIDAPAAWLELSGLPAGGRVRAGRTTVFGVIGPVRFDGGRLRVAPTEWLAAEAYGGLQVRSGTFLGNDAFAPPGSLRLDTPDDLEPERVPYVALPSRTWLVGGSVEVGRPQWARARVGFREVQDGDGAVARRLAVSLVSRPLRALRLSGSSVWDLYDGALIDAAGEVGLELGDVTTRVRLAYHEPRFDPGTIWAYFDTVPVSEAAVSTEWRATEHVRFGVGVRGRRADIDTRVELDAGVEGYAQLHFGLYRLEVDGSVFDGDLGPLATVNLVLARRFGRRVRLSLRGSVWHFDDPLRANLDGTSIAEAFMARIELTEITRVGFELEHAHNDVVGHRFRGMAFLLLRVWR